VSFDFNVCYSSCWGYSLINTLKLKKHKYRHARQKIAHLDCWTRSAKAWHFPTPYNVFQSSDVKLHTYTHDEKEQKIVNRTCWDIGLKEGQGILLAVLECLLSAQCHCQCRLSDLKTCLAVKFVESRHCAAAFSLQVQNSCANLDPTLLYILIFRTLAKFVRKSKMLALGVCFPQPCLSDGRRFLKCVKIMNYYQTISTFAQEQVRWHALATQYLSVST